MFPSLCMEAKFGLLGKKKVKKRLTSFETKFFQKNSQVHPFWSQKEWRNFGRVESWRQTKKIQIKLSVTCNRMNSSRMAKIVLNCRQNGRRWLGRPLKRLLDKAERGLSRPHSWWMMMMMMIIHHHHVKNEEVLQSIKEERKILHTVKKNEC